MPSRPSDPTIGWWDVALVGLLAAVFLFLSVRDISPAPYGYDEADYMYAASKGVLANATDSPSRSVLEFVRIGLQFGRGEGKRTDLSEYARGAEDVHFYRHWHGPLLAYWLALSSSWLHGEQAMRTATLIFPILILLIIYGGCLWTLPAAQARASGCLAGALFVWSYPVMRGVDLGPHPIFVLCYLAALVLGAKALESGRRAYAYGAMTVAGVTFGMLGVAFVLLLTLAALGYLERKRLASDWKFARNSLALCAAGLLFVWPAAILKLSLLKTYMFMAYLALFRRSPWGQATLLETWTLRFLNSPAEWLLLLAAVAMYLLKRDLPHRRLALPFLIFGALMTLVLLRMNTDSARYTLPFLPAFHVFTGLTLGSWLAGRKTWGRAAILAGLMAILFLNTQRQIQAHPVQPDPRPPAMLAQITSENLQTKSLLVPQGDVPVIHYYFPRARLRGYLEESSIPAELGRRAFDAVLYPGYPVRLVLTAPAARKTPF